jgi:cytochrome c5
MKAIQILLLSIFATVAIIACKKGEAPKYDCSAVTPTYTANIKAIMNTSCATSNCHSATKKASGIDLSSFAEVKIHSSHSSFMGSMHHLNGFEAMPQNGPKLSDDQLKTISCWIDNGKKE